MQVIRTRRGRYQNQINKMTKDSFNLRYKEYKEGAFRMSEYNLLRKTGPWQMIENFLILVR